MTTYPIIKNPEFIDLQKNFVRMTLEDENGKQTVAEFKVPQNRELGVNEFWDRIVAEHDVEAMRRRRNELEVRTLAERERIEKKRKAQVENESLRQLFDQKLYYFNLPFINELNDEEKSSIRRAPNLTLLQVAATSSMIGYMQRTGKTLVDIFDEIEDSEFQEASNTANQQTSENT